MLCRLVTWGNYSLGECCSLGDILFHYVIYFMWWILFHLVNSYLFSDSNITWWYCNHSVIFPPSNILFHCVINLMRWILFHWVELFCSVIFSPWYFHCVIFSHGDNSFHLIILCFTAWSISCGEFCFTEWSLFYSVIFSLCDIFT